MKLEQRMESCRLREEGLSIKQIALLVGVSKGSVSTWVRDIKLSTEGLININRRLRLGRERSRQSRLNNICKARNELYEECKEEILPISNRDLWIAGLMLYAGEGRKKWNVSSQPIELTNSEPNILRTFLNFLTKVCNVPRSKIKIRLFLYPDINLAQACNFWSRELNIPLSQFQKPFIKQSYNNPIRSRRSKFGTVHIVLHDAKLYRKIIGWLRAVYGVMK